MWTWREHLTVHSGQIGIQCQEEKGANQRINKLNFKCECVYESKTSGVLETAALLSQVNDSVSTNYLEEQCVLKSEVRGCVRMCIYYVCEMPKGMSALQTQDFLLHSGSRNHG